MKYFFKRYKLLIILAGYAFLVFLAFKFLLLPFSAKIAETSSEIRKRQVDNKINRDRVEKIPEMEADWQNFLENRSSLEVILDKNGEVEFIKKLEAMAEATGNEIDLKVLEKSNLDAREIQRNKKIADKKEEKEKTIEESIKYEDYIILNINLRGKYANLVSFIKKIENADNYVNVISINSKKDKLEKNSIVRTPSFDAFSAQEQVEEENKNEAEDGLKSGEFISSSIEVVVYIKK